MEVSLSPRGCFCFPIATDAGCKRVVDLLLVYAPVYLAVPELRKGVHNDTEDDVEDDGADDDEEYQVNYCFPDHKIERFARWNFNAL